MATDTDLVASKAAALRLAKRMGCTGAHQRPDGKWMPCATMAEYEKLKKTQPDSEKNGIEIIKSRRRYRNSKGKNKREGWEKLGERGLTSIDTITGGGLVGGRSGSIKAAGGWAPDDKDPDVFTNPRLARRRARQLGCIGIARRTSRAGKTVWTPCSNMTDYAKRTGSTAFGRNFQRRQARRTLERAVAREVRRQVRRKKSLMETLYESKALGRKLRAARIATTTPFNPDARDADMDMLVQEGTPWERPARPRIPQIGTNRAGRRRAERGADRRERRHDLSQPQRRRPRQEARQTTVDESDGFASQRYEFGKRFPGFASERAESVEELRKEILDRVGEEHRNKDHREVHFVFGPPGAGKTARVDDGTLHVPGKGEAAHTDPDIYKRFDPAWNDGEGADVAHGRSRWESRETIREAEKLGMDVVVQGTGKDGQLISELVYVDGKFEKGRQQNVTSIMHFIWSSDRDRRIFDRGVDRGPDDQRRRFGTDPRDAAEIRNRITKYIEEGRLDEFYIYDNDVGPDESPPVIASFLDGALVIHDDDKFDEIFTETDADGNPVLLTPGGYISPGVHALSDDPRIGKTHAQRIRDFGEDPEAYKKYDEKKRNDIAEGARKPERGGYGLRGNLTEEQARIAEGLGYNQEWRDRMRALDRGEDPDAEEGYPSQRSLGDEYRMAQRAQGWASQRDDSFEDRYGEEAPQGDGDCFLASVKAGRELEAAGVDNHGNPISNVRIVHGVPLGTGGDAEGLRYPHAWIEYDVETPEPVFHRDLLDPETQRQILERIPDDMRKEFMELIKVAQRFEQQIKDGESGLFDQLGVPRSGKRTMIRDYANIRKDDDSDELEPYFKIDREELVAGRPDFDKEWYYNKGNITEEDILGEFSLDEMETLQEEFGIQHYSRDEANDILGMLEETSSGLRADTGGARRKRVAEMNQRTRRESGYASSREELKSEDGPLAKMFPDSTERERGYLAYQLLANGVGGEDDRVPQELWDTFVRLVEEEHPGIMERLDAVAKTIETLDGYERLTQSGLVSAPGIVNGVDPGQIGEPVTLYHAGYVDLRQADGTFAGKARQQFGPGVYTASEAFTVLYGWARPKRGADGIQTGQPGYLHTLKWTGDGSPRILDMEEPLPDDLLDLALDHLHDLNRFVAAADPVKERPSTPDEIANHSDDSTWTMDIYRKVVHEEIIDAINETIERIRRSREQGRTQKTGREILGPNEGLADIFKQIEITPDGIIDLSGNPDGWVKPAVVDRMRTKLNNDLMEAGYDVLRAKDVGREEFMFLDPSKVEFVDSAKISSMDPFGNTAGHALKQILADEGGYASTREPSVGRGRPLRDGRGRSIDRVFDPDADYTSEDLKEWTMPELVEAARSLDVPFAEKTKKKLIEDILQRRGPRRRSGGRGAANAEPSQEQQLGMLRNQYRNAETLGDQDEMDRLTDEMKKLGSRPIKRRGYSSEREDPEFLHLLSTLTYDHLSELIDGVFIDPAVIPEDSIGEARVHTQRLIEIAGEAQMQKLRNANPDVPDDKLYRLAREVDPLLGNDPSVVGERSFHWSNDSEISVGMRNLPDDALDRVTRRFLAEFDRRAEVERLRTERDPKTQQPLRLGGLTDKEIEAQQRLQRRSRFLIEQGLEDTGPLKYDRDYLDRLTAEKATREKRGDWTTPDLPRGFASSRTDPPPPPENVMFRTEKFWGEPNLIVPEPSGSQWVKTPDGSYARFSTRPKGEGTGDVFVEPLSGWHSPRKYVFVTEKVAHAAQVTGIPPEDKDVSPDPKVGLHALSMGPTPEQTHVSDRIIEVPRRRPTIPMKTPKRGFESSREDDSDDNVVDAGDRFTQWQRKPGETLEEYIYRRAEEDPEWAKRFREILLGPDPEEEPNE